jgi:hypothetical protein
VVDMAVVAPYAAENVLVNPCNPLGNCPMDSAESPCNPLGNYPTESSEPPTSIVTNISSPRAQYPLKLSPWTIRWAASQRIDSTVYPSYLGLGRGEVQLE